MLKNDNLQDTQNHKQSQKHNHKHELESSRRKFVLGFSKLIGVGAASSLLAGNSISVALAYSPSADSAEKNGKLLTQAQLILLKAVCAQVIPKTDTPGAAEVDTHGFIDNQLFHCHSQNEQQQVITLLTDLENESQAAFQQQFIKLPVQQQFQLLTDFELGNARFGQKYRGPFKFLKHLICFGYYTSEVGASQELRFLAVPGGYKGSIEYKKTDANWGSMGLYY